MKPFYKFKLVTITLSIVLILGWMVFSAVKKSDFATKPRAPKQQVAITYNVGWWAYQDSLVIDSFQVTILESKLNLFHSNSLISYRVKGRMKHTLSFRPRLDKVHISERFVREFDRKGPPGLRKDTGSGPEALIEITPVVNVDADKKYNGESIAFEFTNEHIVQSFHWGRNKIRLACMGKFQDIEVYQDK